MGYRFSTLIICAFAVLTGIVIRLGAANAVVLVDVRYSFCESNSKTNIFFFADKCIVAVATKS